MEKQILLCRAAFLSTLQLVITDSNNQEVIKGFASGFFLRHNGRHFFITADHVVHLDDHDTDNETGQRMGVDYIPQIITNNQNREILTSINIPVGGFHYLTGYKLNKEEFSSPVQFLSAFSKIAKGNIDINDESLPIDVRIPSFPDMAIAEMKEPFSCNVLSNLVVDDNGNQIVAEGTPKIVLDSQYTAPVHENKWCIVAGTVKNSLENSVNLIRVNVVHNSLTYHGRDSDKNLQLSTPELPDIDDWAGLSGAPVLNEDELLVGMLIRGPKTDPIVTVVPIDKILWFINKIIENDMSELS